MALVLSRKKGQSIVINEETEIVVLEVKGSVVRFGIRAPRELPIRRGELPPLPKKGPAEPAKE